MGQILIKYTSHFLTYVGGQCGLHGSREMLNEKKLLGAQPARNPIRGFFLNIQSIWDSSSSRRNVTISEICLRKKNFREKKELSPVRRERRQDQYVLTNGIF